MSRVDRPNVTLVTDGERDVPYVPCSPRGTAPDPATFEPLLHGEEPSMSRKAMWMICVVLLGALAACGGGSSSNQGDTKKKGTVVITGTANQ
jgi:hypothetical protein